MNKFYLFILLCSPFFIQGQITLTADDLPQVGDVYTTIDCDVPIGFSVGSAGANQTYDLSTLIPTDTTQTAFVASAVTPGFSDFPNSTIAVEDEDSYVYYQQTNDAFLLLGIYIDTSANGTGQYASSHFTPALKQFEIPTTYNTSFQSTSTLTLTFPDDSGTFDSIRSTAVYVDNRLVDGYGTVITPNGSFNGLRERSISTDSNTFEVYSFGTWATLSTNSSTDTSYNWYSNNNFALASAFLDGGEISGASYSAEGVVVVTPAASFSSNNLGGGLVDFTDASSNLPSSWLWNFDDGNTSTEQDPQHTFATPGTYNVCLTVTNSAGSDMTCMDVVISFAPMASFTFVTQSDGDVNFTDASSNTPTSWLWNFDDGNTSTTQNPAHNFASAGIYNVCLTATNSSGSDMTCMNVTVSYTPDAAFTFTIASDGLVDFADASSNSPTSWIWDFEDGNTSTEQNPQYTFATAGTFNVCLTANNSSGSDMTCQDVVVAFTPDAAFTFTIASDGLVDFTDASNNAPTSWIWDFEDGNTSTEQNPQHTFATAGTFNVCLTANNSSGSDMVCQDVNVIITAVKDLLAEMEVAIFPNPVGSNLNIRLENQSFAFLKFQLINTLGQTIKSKSLAAPGSYAIDVQGLSPSLYYYLLIDQDGLVRRRGSFVKE